MKLFVITLIGLIIVACHTPRPLSKLKVTDEEKISWWQGSQVVSMDYYGLLTQITYLESTPEFYIFHVSAINKSDVTYMIDPAEFVFDIDKFRDASLVKYADGKYLDTTSDDRFVKVINMRTRYYAINPELQILQIEHNISRSDAELRNAVARQVVGEIISTTADVAAAVKSDDTPEARLDRSIQRADRHEYYRSDLDSRSNDIESSKMVKNVWANETLRKTTLYPNYEVGGLVFFKRNDAIAEMTFNFKIQNIDNFVKYQQYIYLP
ncbi:MAG: hypothetical protein KIT33_12970 [Candidatus Kapabacteria bacterium]|nr:hypothetical protein [Ignavibacteriota bacterium]MCW5885874.1 hypothetical protein [Candidatus Kapabacteria bacterium]